MTCLISIIIIILDQLTKNLAINYLKGNTPIVIIDGTFELVYVENRGAAFGILQDKRIIFIILTILVLLFLIVYCYKNYHRMTTFSNIAIAMLIGGAAGNLIDRIRFGYVVDFLKVDLLRSYNFPVFNLADIFIVVSTILLAYIILFDKYEVK